MVPARAHPRMGCEFVFESVIHPPGRDSRGEEKKLSVRQTHEWNPGVCSKAVKCFECISDAGHTVALVLFFSY